MNAAVKTHMDNLIIRLKAGQVSYEHIAGAIDALIVADAITLTEARTYLTEAKRATMGH